MPFLRTRGPLIPFSSFPCRDQLWPKCFRFLNSLPLRIAAGPGRDYRVLLAAIQPSLPIFTSSFTCQEPMHPTDFSLSLLHHKLSLINHIPRSGEYLDRCTEIWERLPKSGERATVPGCEPVGAENPVLGVAARRLACSSIPVFRYDHAESDGNTCMLYCLDHSKHRTPPCTFPLRRS